MAGKPTKDIDQFRKYINGWGLGPKPPKESDVSISTTGKTPMGKKLKYGIKVKVKF